MDERICISCNNVGIRLPSTKHGFAVEKREKKQTQKIGDKKEQAEEATLDEVIPQSMLSPLSTDIDHQDEIEGNYDIHDVLMHVPLDAETANEIATCPVDEDTWGDELLLALSNETNQQEVDATQMESSANDNLNDHNVNASLPSSSPVGIDPKHLDYDSLFKLFTTDSHANTKGHWERKNIEFLHDHLSSATKLKQLRDVDLKVVIRFLKRHMKEKFDAININLKESDKKQIKFIHLCTIFGYETHGIALPTRRVHKLSDMCLKILQTKVPKRVLNIAHAEYHWLAELDKWENSSTIQNTVKIEGTDDPEYWFYQPEFNEQRQQIEVKCIDSTHLLTRTRRKCCKGGLDSISNVPWLRVAKGRKTLLSVVMIEDIIDPMSVSMAVTNFSEPVQHVMIENGDIEAASLCHDVRNWWSAEDDPGIAAMTRIEMRKGLRQRLLSHVNWNELPSPTMFIKGWPIQLWEAIVANVDAKALLYGVCQNGQHKNKTTLGHLAA